jgi:hypothetical protein
MCRYNRNFNKKNNKEIGLPGAIKTVKMEKQKEKNF